MDEGSGDDSDSGDDSGSDSSESEDEEAKNAPIIDSTETNLISLR